VVLSPANVRLHVFTNGTVEMATASHDIGTGTYTILTQIVGDLVGLPHDRIEVALGDTLLPRSPAAGGSTTAPSVVSAAHLAALKARRQLVELAISDAGSPAIRSRSRNGRPG
jgi:xanthine dehydrogenase YagR molybdenum-binding subunit